MAQSHTFTTAEQAADVHLSRASRPAAACRPNLSPGQAAAYRLTRYPALVTCKACRSTFTADETRTASGQETEPYDC